MIGKNELKNFKKMWTWLTGHPAHDQQYYMEHVAKLESAWANSCPLSNSDSVKDCSGCSMLWDSKNGTLCTDPAAPLYKWQNTEKNMPDDRSFYASQTAVLAMHLINDSESTEELCKVRRAA